MGLLGKREPWTINEYKTHKKARKIIAKCKDPCLLVEIADKANDYNYKLNINALERLNRLLESERFDNETLRFVALTRVNPKLNYTNNSGSPENVLRRAHEKAIVSAINQIDDEQILKGIALFKFKEDEYYAFDAMCKITDRDILQEIESQTRDDYTKKLAARFAAFQEDDGLSFGKKLRLAQNDELSKVFDDSPILRPYGWDIHVVMKQNHFTWSENGHSYVHGDPASFRASANRLISLAQEQPKYLVPIWDRLTKQINEATDSRETWQWNGEYETINTYDDGPRTIREKELVTSTNGMGLQFPELQDEFRTS